MPWVCRRFKNQRVWVRSDETGRPVLDADGRAEMKYREGDVKTYRPLPQNLSLDSDAQEQGAAAPAGAKAGAKTGGRTIHVWTDGACSGNPGPMGIGVVVIDGAHRRELGEYLGIGTNNIAELTAIERGLAVAAEIDPARVRPLRVHSDSGYALGLLAKGWKAKANQELVACLRRAAAAFAAIHWVKVSGHAGVAENERCDELARAAIAARRSVAG